ncbi:hypothetical protein Gura_1097 [Geotalea uraniireducens Rf4]|uniref:Cell division protein ZapB n=2 Tax=Geotalea uraniireducens TaxID=351604 RepID=A5GAV1_GEOUR|nr:hypothetical protein Gura_1097 [Geotalea uraniireducens Rf4]
MTFAGLLLKILALKGTRMDAKLIDELEKRIESLLTAYGSLKDENRLLRDENNRLQHERGGFKNRIDAILNKLEEVERS